MKKKGNSILFNSVERKVLKSLIDRKFGKVTSSIDYESTSGLKDRGLEGDIFQKTGGVISGSTLERMVGLTSDTRKCTVHSLNIVATYLDFTTVPNLLEYISRNSKIARKQRDGFTVPKFLGQHYFKIRMGDDKTLIIKLLAENKFEIVKSENSLLAEKDVLLMGKLELKKQLELYKVFRTGSGKPESLGGYSSGYNNLVTEISFIKAPSNKDEQDELFT